MRDNDGPKLDHKTLKTLRFRAVDQVERGARVEVVAETPGMAFVFAVRWPSTGEGARSA